VRPQKAAARRTYAPLIQQSPRVSVVSRVFRFFGVG
jgi:hypothetical protein